MISGLATSAPHTRTGGAVSFLKQTFSDDAAPALTSKSNLGRVMAHWLVTLAVRATVSRP